MVPWAQSNSKVAPVALTVSETWSPPHWPGGSCMGEAGPAQAAKQRVTRGRNRRIVVLYGPAGGWAAERGDEADEARGGTRTSLQGAATCPRGQVRRGHRFAAYPRCWADQWEVDVKQASAADIPEPELVERLTSSWFHRSWALNVEGIASDGVVFRGIQLGGLPGNPRGDVDILVVPPGSPQLAAAVQVKRIKVDAEGLETDRPNNLGSLKTGVRQTNLLANLGFHRVYLFVIVVVDSRARNAGRVGYEGLSPQLDAKISGWISPAGLAARAGLFHLEIVQAMDIGGPLESGTSGVRQLKPAEPIAQSPDVTAWISQLESRGRPTRG